MVESQASQAPVLLCGYYGEHNLGDDALLEVLLGQLPPGCRVVVTARDGPSVRRRFAVETVDRRSLPAVLAALGRCRALVLGGGSLLQDATSLGSLLYYGLLILAARLRGRPVLLWAQGLGPLRRRRSRQLVRLLLSRVTAVSWRDRASAELGARLGCRGGLLGSDPVWGMAPRRWQGPGGAIVLCWRPVAGWSGRHWRPYLAAVERLALERGRQVIWLPFHADQDAELLEQLKAQGLISAGLAARSVVRRPDSPEAALDLLATASLVLAMRLHGLILAAVAGSPCVALSYDPKVEAAAADLGCICHRLCDAPAQDLAARWLDVFEKPAAGSRLEELRRQADRHREVLAVLAVPS